MRAKHVYLRFRDTMGKLCQQRKLDTVQNCLIPTVMSVVKFSKDLINPQICYLKKQQCCRTAVWVSWKRKLFWWSMTCDFTDLKQRQLLAASVFMYRFRNLFQNLSYIVLLLIMKVLGPYFERNRNTWTWKSKIYFLYHALCKSGLFCTAC